jgi:5-carboxymethyl-2-hydroxymuconate isomerase
MPHLTLRYSDNLKNKNFIPFFHEAHKILCATLQVKPASCSSMATMHEQYLIGNGESEDIFIHLDVLAKSKRYTEEILCQVSHDILNALKNYLESQSIENIKTSVHVFETSYFCKE